jgi:hypothetical protein
MTEYLASAPDGWSYTADPSASGAAAPNAGPRSGQKHAFPAQAGNTLALTTANQAFGMVAAPALASGATGTVTWTNSLINANSIISVRGCRRGTTTPAAGALAALIVNSQAPGAGTVVLDVRNAGTAATLATDYEIQLEVLATSAG